MYCLSGSALSIVAVTIPAVLLGCGGSSPTPGRDASTASGTGGDIVATGAGGARLGTGGGSDSGATGLGGSLGTGGELATGGATSTGGTMVGHGGAPGTGGTTGPGGSLRLGGSTGAGGATVNGGATGTGGTAGRAGAAGGGTTGKGGATGSTTFPGKFVGNIDTRGSIRSDFVTFWEQFAPENAGKWASVQASAGGTFNWTVLDAMYKYTEDNGILFKEHCFLFASSLPAWMANLTSTTGPPAVQSWMKAFCERYPKTRLIDVVNEPPPHATPVFVNAIGGGNNTTWDWIANAFKWAREACPDAILIMNDYDNAEYATTAQHNIDIVNAIKKLDAPIDAIGCGTYGADKLPASTLKANIDLITSSTGLPVYITQYEINLADDDEQKAQYQDHFTMFMSNPNVKGITVWGYIEGATWRPNTGIMTSDGTMRPAMTWLMDFLGR